MSAKVSAVLLGILMWSHSGFAANRIVSTFGAGSNLCAGSGRLLSDYVKYTNELRQLKANGAQKEVIARYEMAIEVLAGGLNPEQYGMTILVQTDGPKTIQINNPTITIDSKTYPMVKLSGSDLSEDSSRLEIKGALSQVKLDFTLLGICSFASPKDGSVGTAEIQSAVDAILGK